MKTSERYWNEEDGLTSVEYALLLGLIVAVGVLAWGTLGTVLGDSAEDSVERVFPSGN